MVDVSIPQQFLTDAIAAIDSARRAYPDLGPNGWNNQGEVETGHVATAIAFIKRGPVQKLRSWRHGESSYSLKHRAERWGSALGFEPYVTNGAFIVAALALSLPVSPSRPSSPNSLIGLRSHEAPSGS